MFQLIISRHWFRWAFGANMQKAISWTDCDHVLRRGIGVTCSPRVKSFAMPVTSLPWDEHIIWTVFIVMTYGHEKSIEYCDWMIRSCCLFIVIVQTTWQINSYIYIYICLYTPYTYPQWKNMGEHSYWFYFNRKRLLDINVYFHFIKFFSPVMKTTSTPFHRFPYINLKRSEPLNMITAILTITYHTGLTCRTWAILNHQAIGIVIYGDYCISRYWQLVWWYRIAHALSKAHR